MLSAALGIETRRESQTAEAHPHPCAHFTVRNHFSESRNGSWWLPWAAPRPLFLFSCVCSAQRQSHFPWGRSACQIFRCFTHEFNKSKSFLTIPRQVSTCQFLTSSEALVSGATRGDTEANYSSPIRLLCTERALQSQGDFSQALSVLAKFLAEPPGAPT